MGLIQEPRIPPPCTECSLFGISLAIYWSCVLAVSLSLSAIGWDVPLSLYYVYYTQWSLTVLVCYLIMAALVTRRHTHGGYGPPPPRPAVLPPSLAPRSRVAWEGRPWQWLGYGAARSEEVVELVAHTVDVDTRYTDAETYYYGDEARIDGAAVDTRTAAAAADGEVEAEAERRVQPDALLRWTWRLQVSARPVA